MKVCPVCNESFADELRFCDVDGTRLTRQRTTSTPQQQNKGWSLFGVALLVGALIISGISVIFLPRAHVSPQPPGSETQVSSANKPAAAETAGNAAAPATSDQPEIVVTEGPVPDLKKKDKSKSQPNGNFSEPTLNPKAAAQSGEEAEKSKQPSEAPVVQPLPTPKRAEPVPAIKTASETREPDSISKPAQPSTEMKKDSRSSKNSDKDSDKKKGEEKDKKKGGFFRVFKKIFGKD